MRVLARSTTAVVMLAVACCAGTAQAAQTSVLSVSGQTLSWTGGAKVQFIVESQPANPTQFVTVSGDSYTPPALAGQTVTYRVRPKPSPHRWSNAVSITYPAEKVEAPPVEEEPPKEEEPPANQGDVKWRLDAKSYCDATCTSSSWLHEHIDRVLGYGAFAWAHYVPTGIPILCYRDAYTHWGSMSLNPTHRAEYVAEVKEDIAHGCAGHFADDIEFTEANQHHPGTDDEVANLVEAVRSAIGPSKILQINTQYADLWPRIKEGNPYAERVLKAVNQVDKEFGVNAASGIGSPSAFSEYLAYVDYLHGRGIHIDQEDVESGYPGDTYELATYLLINDGGDYTGGRATPSEWDPKYHTNLGAALGGREQVGSAYRRRFAKGTVYVNPPGAATATVDGHTLTARSGLIAP